MDLATKKCQPCEGKVEPFNKEKAEEFLNYAPDWELSTDGKLISRKLVMKNFTAAVDAINKIKEIAENDDHHPDIHLTGYRNLKIDLSTHAIGGLSENDFILAVKIDKLPWELKS